MNWQQLGEHTADLVWAFIRWGFLGLATVVAIYVLCRKFGALETRTNASPWIRRGVLALWIVIAPPLAGAVGTTLTAERLARETIREQAGPIGRDLGVSVGEPAFVLAIGATGAAGGAPARTSELRLSVADVRAAKGKFVAELETIKQQTLTDIQTSSKSYTSVKVWVVEQAYDSMINRPVNDRLRVYDEVVDKLEPLKAADGTVGSAELGEVASDYVATLASDYASKAFSSTRIYLYGLLILLFAIPCLVAFFVRRRAQPSNG